MKANLLSQTVFDKAADLVAAAMDDPEFAVALWVAASNMTAAAAEADPDNPAKRLKQGLDEFSRHTRKVFREFVRRREAGHPGHPGRMS